MPAAIPSLTNIFMAYSAIKQRDNVTFPVIVVVVVIIIVIVVVVVVAIIIIIIIIVITEE
jgi:hypothetical protein